MAKWRAKKGQWIRNFLPETNTRAEPWKLFHCQVREFLKFWLTMIMSQWQWTSGCCRWGFLLRLSFFFYYCILGVYGEGCWRHVWLFFQFSRLWGFPLDCIEKTRHHLEILFWVGCSNWTFDCISWRGMRPICRKDSWVLVHVDIWVARGTVCQKPLLPPSWVYPLPTFF